MTVQEELLAWAAAKLNEAQSHRLYGSVTFIFEAGTITRAETKRQERPASVA